MNKSIIFYPKLPVLNTKIRFLLKNYIKYVELYNVAKNFKHKDETIQEQKLTGKTKTEQ